MLDRGSHTCRDHVARRNRDPREAGEVRGSVAENEVPESPGLGDQSEERSELVAKKVPTP